MSKGSDKRQAIFDKYLQNLDLLINLGHIQGRNVEYICPICLSGHTTIDSDNPLTLEDAPPKSLGGSAGILTCKSCNNTLGTAIDSHLASRLNELDAESLIPGTERKITVTIEEQEFRGFLRVDKDGSMHVYHSKKQNHPEKLDEAMQELKLGEKIDAKFINSRLIPENFEYALLKTAYLLAFQKLGYSLILDECFDIVRKQLLDITTRIYPTNFWLMPSAGLVKPGVYFILNEGIESLIVFFVAQTQHIERLFGVILPLPVSDLPTVIHRIHLRAEANKLVELTLYPYDQNSIDYIKDEENINALFNWINLKK